MKLLRVPALLLFLRCLPAQDLSLDLVAAARSGDLSQVKALLDKGADVNARGRYGQTALLFASNRGHLEVVKLLLAAGADVDAGHTFYGATALTWAATKGYVDIVRLLIGKTEGGPAKVLPVAVLRGNAALVKLAIENGAAKADLWSALVAAERAKKAEIVELLKSSGAQPPPPATFQIDSSSLASYAGRYRGRAGAGFDFIFSVKDGKLLGEVAGQPAVTYAPIGKTQFQSVELTGVHIDFQVAGEKVVGFTLRQGAAIEQFLRH